MTISMWTIASGLAELKPVVYISTGEAHISGVRWLMSGPPSEKHVYISTQNNAEELDASAGVVVCENQGDRIILAGVAPFLVFNRVLEIFDFYNQWENTLEMGLHEGRMLQWFVDASDAVIGNPISLSDTSGHITAISQCYPVGSVNADWDYCVTERKVPVATFQHSLSTSDGQPVTNWKSEPAIYCYPSDQLKAIGAYLKVEDETVGSLFIIEWHTKLDKGLLQLTDILCRFLSRHLELTGREAELRTWSSSFIDILEGIEVELNEVELALNRNGQQTSKNQQWQLIAIKNILREHDAGKIMAARQLEASTDIPMIFVYRDYVLALSPCVDIEQCITQISQNLDARIYQLGISLPFTDFFALSTSLKQAELALEYGDTAAGNAHYCSTYTYNFILREFYEKSDAIKLELLHPALKILRQYDEIHISQLYQTLYEYLSHERNLVETAAALYIHRNSLIYRINRIKQLVGVDLDSSYERSYLLLSYHLLQQAIV